MAEPKAGTQAVAGAPVVRIAITALALLVTIQNVKDQTESFTWYNAAIHYTGMQALWMLYLGVLISMLRRTRENDGRRAYALYLVAMQILPCWRPARCANGYGRCRR